MLKKENRLPARYFREKYRVEKRNSLFVVKKRDNGLLLRRFAVVITKRVDKRSSHRNRLKRKIYELIRKNKLEEGQGEDIIIFVLPRVLKEKDEYILFALCELLA